MRKLMCTLVLLCCCNMTFAQSHHIEQYDVVWDTPSKNAHGSMPLGNGDITVNTWVEENGDLLCYIGKSDSWGPHGRLLKVGRVRVTLDPPLSTRSFKQRLNLNDGIIEIASSDGQNIRLWVDANQPIIHVEIDSNNPTSATLLIEPWRVEQEPIPNGEVSDTYEDRTRPNRLRSDVQVYPDTIIDNLSNQIGWFHFSNIKSHYEELIEIQGIQEVYESEDDPYLHRVFGAIVSTKDGVRVNDHELRTKTSDNMSFQIHVLTEHPSSPEEWLNKIQSNIEHAQDADSAWESHKRWWNDFWNRSWIEVSGDADGEHASLTYTLQRFVDACAGRGAYPIKFNGSTFVVPHEGKWGDADYRRWGPGYWWQNTRLPYLSMNASGDFDLQEPLFKMYVDDLFDINLHRTKQYTGHGGFFMPECIYHWGGTFAATYEWSPPYAERGEDKLQKSPWHKWEWVSSLELAFMMFDYYEHTQDDAFLQERLIPYATEALRFYVEQFETDEDGILVMYPSMALETWWDTTNPLPDVAGMHAVTKRLLRLPQSKTTEAQRAYWNEVASTIPELPLRTVDGVRMLAPAERFEKKHNVENPELYAVFPFKLVTFDSALADLGVQALHHRWDKGAFGWRQDDLFMTHLGLTGEAKANLISRSRNKHSESRFPVFWGPNYDWVPDQDHGGVLMRTLQTMLMQTDGKKIHLLPAWPKEWDVEFKLHAPFNTTVSGSVRDGQIEWLNVEPEERQKDIEIHGDNLEVINWNTYHLFDHREELENATDWLAEESPDILALQECLHINEAQLKQRATSWGHEHAVMHKESGYPVALTSTQPIKVVDRVTKGFHHGYLHARTHGIEVFVVHFWPTKPHEAQAVAKLAEQLMHEGKPVIVMGDFNGKIRCDNDYLIEHGFVPEESVDEEPYYEITDTFLDKGFIELVSQHSPHDKFSFGSPALIPRWSDSLDDVVAKRRRIDFIFASPDIAESSFTAHINTDDTTVGQYSDHYPVCCVISKSER